jgi:hypothetical protein
VGQVNSHLMFDDAMRWYLVPAEMVIGFTDAKEGPSEMFSAQFGQYAIKKKCSLTVDGETFHYDPNRAVRA